MKHNDRLKITKSIGFILMFSSCIFVFIVCDVNLNKTFFKFFFNLLKDPGQECNHPIILILSLSEISKVIIMFIAGVVISIISMYFNTNNKITYIMLITYLLLHYGIFFIMLNLLNFYKEIALFKIHAISIFTSIPFSILSLLLGSIFCKKLWSKLRSED